MISDNDLSGVTANQKGIVLLVGLIMVLLMTIVGLAAIRGTGLQESMAGNMRDRNVAFQAAEAGLRVGEDFAEEQPLHELAFNGSEEGLIEDVSESGDGSIASWDAEDWGVAKDAGIDLDGVSDQPRFVIERLDVSEYDLKRMLGLSATQDMPFDVNFYRISSQGTDGTGKGDSVVQSHYIKLN